MDAITIARTIFAAIVVAISAGIGWVVAAFIGRPFRQFFDLRKEAHRCVILSLDFIPVAGSISIGEQILGRMSGGPLDDVVSALRHVGTQLVAFEAGEWAAMLILRTFGYKPRQAGREMIAYSGSLSLQDGQQMQAQLDAILAALKLE